MITLGANLFKSPTAKIASWKLLEQKITHFMRFICSAIIFCISQNDMHTCMFSIVYVIHQDEKDLCIVLIHEFGRTEICENID